MVEPVFQQTAPRGRRHRGAEAEALLVALPLASFLIVVAVAAATTASSILLFIDTRRRALPQRPLQNKLERLLANVDGGEPENILILGSDKRASEPGDPGRSDTTMLLRLDPDRNAIALMSIPRDLKVEIPGFGTEKFNAAYTYGGPKLTLRVVKELTGLPINHVVNVDFLGFVRAVDAIGCVYVDVDRRYYHSNAESSEEYAEINVQPGYQLLCGKKALQYVALPAHRHRPGPRRAPAGLPQRRPPAGADRRPGRSTATSCSTSSPNTRPPTSATRETMLEVLKLFIDSRNAEINEVHFPAELGPSYVYASPEAIEGAVDKFLGIEASGGPRGSLEGSPKTSRNGKAKKKAQEEEEEGEAAGRGAEAAGQRRTGARPRSGRARGEDRRPQGQRRLPGLLPDAAALGRRLRRKQPLSDTSQDPRVYHFKDTDGNSHAAYRMVLQRRPLRRHPLLRRPGDPRLVATRRSSATRAKPATIHGREYDIYLDGDRVELIAWHRGDNSYWIANDLLNTLTNDQMLGMARSADVIVPNPKPKQEEGRRGGGEE